MTAVDPAGAQRLRGRRRNKVIYLVFSNLYTLRLYSSATISTQCINVCIRCAHVSQIAKCFVKRTSCWFVSLTYSPNIGLQVWLMTSRHTEPDISSTLGWNMRFSNPIEGDLKGYSLGSVTCTFQTPPWYGAGIFFTEVHDTTHIHTRRARGMHMNIHDGRILDPNDHKLDPTGHNKQQGCVREASTHTCMHSI